MTHSALSHSIIPRRAVLDLTAILITRMTTVSLSANSVVSGRFRGVLARRDDQDLMTDIRFSDYSSRTTNHYLSPSRIVRKLVVLVFGWGQGSFEVNPKLPMTVIKSKPSPVS